LIIKNNGVEILKMWPLLVLLIVLLFIAIPKNTKKVYQNEEDMNEEDEDNDLFEEFLILELTDEDDETE